VDDGQNKQQTVPIVVQTRLTSAGLTWSGGLAGYAASCDDWQPIAGGNNTAVSGCGWGGSTGSEARVQITTPYPFQFLSPLLVLLPGDGTIGPKVLSTNFVMRNE
jgi:hypothetical protein